VRLDDALRLLGFLVGGEAGASADLRLAMKASPDALFPRENRYQQYVISPGLRNRPGLI
jgi:hypothetical protein